MKTTNIPFDIISKESEPILFTENIPEFFRHYEMADAMHTVAFGSFGHLSFQEWQFHELAISIRYINLLAMKDEAFTFSNNQDDLKLRFALNNDFCSIEEGTEMHELLEGSFNMYYVPFVHAEQILEANRLYSDFSIHFSQAYLDNWCSFYPILRKFLEKIENRQAATLCDANQITSPQMNGIIQQIINNKYVGVARSMYIDIKIRELIMLVMDTVSNYPTPCNNGLTKSEIEQFSEAKNLLLSNLQNPMSLKQMSRKFGINIKKIKSGFKQLYQMTPFNLLLTTRMEKAKNMLTCTDIDIVTIAEETGYDNKHSFSKAFKKYFGFTPGQCRKKKEQQSFEYLHN